ncbi:MAG: hypothetical protein IIY70_06125, partial [Oscillospiraceae bacterium]|nr:hypothetical protein [Oscillospiraceae bacterium]
KGNQIRSVLLSRFDILGKLPEKCLSSLPGTATFHLQMCSHMGLDTDIFLIAPFRNLHLAQRTIGAVETGSGEMWHILVWIAGDLHPAALVTLLTAGLFPTWLFQTLRGRLAVTVAGRRLGAVAAVLVVFCPVVPEARQFVLSKLQLDLVIPHSVSSTLKPSAAKTQSLSFQLTPLYEVFLLVLYRFLLPLERLNLICLFAFRHFAIWKSPRLPCGY